ncbi:MAG: pseudouridine synthase [Bacteroidetes bacterium]|jgi:23S rRNA pseudouridine2605 synthase|nr:pseudouridine synthase [Bacteroidota bacterium]
MKEKRPTRGNHKKERPKRPRPSQNEKKSRPSGNVRKKRPSEGQKKKRPSTGQRKERPFSGGRKRREVPKARKSPSSPKDENTVGQKAYLDEEIRLNKYIAHSGFCSRRDADEYIATGMVKVNGEVVTELGTKVTPSDSVIVNNQTLSLEPFTYILLNKGKDTISTTDDEKDRNTVLDAVRDATGKRVYPVGRLDRNTMGLLLLTNDGDLAHRLMHPSYRVKKTYEVTSDRLLKDNELKELASGIELEDGPAQPTELTRSFKDPHTVIISVFEGRNHLIRRMIGYFEAEVTKLKRTYYAGLSDKDLRVGRWRYLHQKEVNNLRKLVKLDTLEFK